MKTNKVLFNSLLVIFTLAISLPAFATAPQVVSVDCKVERKQFIAVSGKKAKLESAVLGKDVSCKQISWKEYTFISVQYNTNELISYSNKYVKAGYYEVFRVNGDKLTTQFSDTIEDAVAVWLEENDHIVMRVKGKDENGEIGYINGYVFVPTKNKWVDYIVFRDFPQ